MDEENKDIPEETKEEVKEEQKPLKVMDMLEQISKKQDQLIQEKKIKKWKIPGKARLSKGQVAKNYATFMVIKDNKEVDFIRNPIEDGTSVIDGFPRIATADFCLTYKGKPLYILPYWSMKPFSPVENYKETEKDKMNMTGRRLVLTKLRVDQIQKKKGNLPFGWILLGIAALGVGYYLIKGGKLF